VGKTWRQPTTPVWLDCRLEMHSWKQKWWGCKRRMAAWVWNIVGMCACVSVCATIDMVRLQQAHVSVDENVDGVMWLCVYVRAYVCLCYIHVHWHTLQCFVEGNVQTPLQYLLQQLQTHTHTAQHHPVSQKGWQSKHCDDTGEGRTYSAAEKQGM
jgi:hypothetical protein